MKDAIASLRMFLVMTILLGVLYPLAMTLVGLGFFPNAASGSPLLRDGHVVGSKLLAQKFTGARYFATRPSAVDFNPLPSGGSNLGPTSADLQKQFAARVQALQKENGDGQPPGELLFASASGLDPEISPEAAEYEAPRVAKARALRPEVVNQLILAHTQGRQWGILGEPRVNVLELNLALDAMEKADGQRATESR